MARFRIEANKKIPFTAEEEKARDAEEKAWADGEAERKLNGVREVRNSLLAETDWMSFGDSPTISDEWKKYRQDLRDITKTYKSLDDVKWPTKPE
tara:strand:- start:27 stop:311 length:285 start_codon:yes stop_codon:yes gene_type:complete